MADSNELFHKRTSSRTVTASPISRFSAFRTLALMGTMQRPSLGNKEVFHSVLPIRTSTGIIPQPYVTNPDRAFRSRLCFAGTVTKYHGAGPFQYQILPLNSMFIVTVYQLLNGWRLRSTLPRAPLGVKISAGG